MTASRLAVLGATGRTGRLLVANALERGGEVTAFVRDPAKLPTHERLHVVLWTPEGDASGFADALRGHDAVISALGVPGLASGGLIERSARVLVPAMEAAGVRRLVFTSAFGVRGAHEVPFPPKLFVLTLLRWVYADKAAGEALITASDLDWTLVYPTGLGEGPAGAIRFGESLALRGMPNINRASLAAFLLDQVSDPAFVRKGLLVTGDP